MITLFFMLLALVAIQIIAAVPWFIAITAYERKKLLASNVLLYGLLILIGAAACGVFFFSTQADFEILERWGRLYGFILQVQLIADFFVLSIFAMLKCWPKAGAVALAAFRESVRQPMFWLLSTVGVLILAVTPLVPYFTMGEDLKMVKEICFSFTMIIPALFGVIAASTSVHEEIEGRTTVTLMSKPVSRRQFLLGKFCGIALAALFMTLLLGSLIAVVVWYKRVFQTTFPEPIPDPDWVVWATQTFSASETASGMIRGWAFWIIESLDVLPHLIIGYCQAMVLIAVAVALATRMPMVINLVICLMVYFLGHLTPIMTAVAKNPLVLFVAQVFDTVLPGLDLFDVSTAIVRDVPLAAGSYALYTFNIVFYGLLYTAIALLLGLILFEDRDLG